MPRYPAGLIESAFGKTLLHKQPNSYVHPQTAETPLALANIGRVWQSLLSFYVSILLSNLCARLLGLLHGNLYTSNPNFSQPSSTSAGGVSLLVSDCASSALAQCHQ